MIKIIKRVLTLKRGLQALMAGMVMLFITTPAFAHPLDEVVQSSYLSIEGKRVGLELNLSAGTLVAPALAAFIDSNDDHIISDDETQTYARRLQSELSLQVDGQARTLVLQKIEMPSWDLVSVGATIKAEFWADAEQSAGTHQVVMTNRHTPAKSVYQNTLLAPDNPNIRIGGQRQNNEQNELMVNYDNGATSGTFTQNPLPNVSGVGGVNELLAALKSPQLSPSALMLTLLLAGVLGGAHALTPGHGKTVAAAYLVGSRGTIKHAIALGGMVTFTHTASVIVLGTVILLLSNTIAPAVLLPVLEWLSALLIILLGCQLLWQRWQALKADSPHSHPHNHGHVHHHGVGGHTHDLPSQITKRNLAMLAVSGGIVPCPEALGILLLAISINRIGFGLGLIAAFSLGLALVLMAIGMVLVSSKRLFTRVSGVGAPLQRWLPLGSALVITLLGASMLIRLIYS